MVQGCEAGGRRVTNAMTFVGNKTKEDGGKKIAGKYYVKFVFFLFFLQKTF